MSNLKVNQKCIVAITSPHHGGRTGYFMFYGKGASDGVTVLAAEPKFATDGSRTYFAVDNGFVLPE